MGNIANRESRDRRADLERDAKDLDKSVPSPNQHAQQPQHAERADSSKNARSGTMNGSPDIEQRQDERQPVGAGSNSRA